jgi:adenylate cyclase class 2
MCADVNADKGLEIEVKIAVEDPRGFQEKADALFLVCTTPRTHEFNLVFDGPDGSLAQRGVLLRLRRWGEKLILTVKSPPDPASNIQGYKVRREVEVGFDDFDRMVQVLGILGFERRFAYEKFRTEYRSPEGLTVTLDETPIGCFAELEGERELIDLYLFRLGADFSQAISRNYRSLFLESGGSGDMLFP